VKGEMMKVFILRIGVVAIVATVACSSSEFRVSPEGGQKAATLLQTINTDLAATCTAGPEGLRYDEMVSRSRAELAELRGVAKTKADRAAMLLLASVLMRDRVRCTLIQMGADETNSTVAEALVKRDVCLKELAPWIEGRGTEELVKAPCLSEGEAAAQTLLIK